MTEFQRERGDGVYKVRVRAHHECTIQMPITTAGCEYRRFVEDGGKKVIYIRV